MGQTKETVFPRPYKIDIASVHLARVRVDEYIDPIDGVLPEETREMIVATGRRKFHGQTLVQVGVLDIATQTSGSDIYRPLVTYEAYRVGRDVYVDLSMLKEGTVVTHTDKRGLWAPLEKVGTIESQ